MLTKACPIDGLEHTFIQPIVKQVVGDLNNKIIKDPEASFYNLGNYQHENVNVGDNVEDNTIQGPMLYIEYNIEPNEEMLLGTSTYHPLNKIIILDRSNGFNIRPSYNPIKLSITITYKARSKTNHHRLIQRLRTHYNNSSYSMAHNLEYSYLIPNNVLALISDINKIKNTDIELHDYINTISLFKLDYTVKRGSDRKTPVFRGVFNNIFGYFETNPNEIEIEKQDDPYYSSSFTYTIEIKEPEILYIQYPIIINNKKLPDTWLPKYNISKTIKNAENEISLSNIIGDYKRFRDNNITMHRVPSYDNFYPLQYDSTNLIRLTSILLEIQPTRLDYLFNINDLKFIGLPLLFIEYLKLCPDKELFEFRESLVYIELYNFNDKKEHGLYQDDEYNIYATKPLDIKGSYHLVINILNSKSLIRYYGKGQEDNDKINRDKVIIDEYHLPIKDIDNNILSTRLR